LKRWYLQAHNYDPDEELPVDRNIVQALSDDLDFSGAIARLHALSKEAESEGSSLLAGTLIFLGFHPKMAKPAEALAVGVESIIELRLEMLKAKNFAEADKIRDDLLAKGIQLKDGKDPATGERVTTWEVKR
jgi:cysteinyl-tRNA synthetase